MANVSEVMSADPQSVQPDDSLRHAAELLQNLDIGVLPVCEDGVLVGIVTDRDIAVRSVAGGLVPEATCVGDIMSPNPAFCTPDQDTEEVMHVMGEKQVRRLPVVDQDKRLVGIVSLADLALRQSGHIDQTVRKISTPEKPAATAGSEEAGGDEPLSGGAGTSPADSAPH